MPPPEQRDLAVVRGGRVEPDKLGVVPAAHPPGGVSAEGKNNDKKNNKDNKDNNNNNKSNKGHPRGAGGGSMWWFNAENNNKDNDVHSHNHNNNHNHNHNNNNNCHNNKNNTSPPPLTRPFGRSSQSGTESGPKRRLWARTLQGSCVGGSVPAVLAAAVRSRGHHRARVRPPAELPDLPRGRAGSGAACGGCALSEIEGALRVWSGTVEWDLQACRGRSARPALPAFAEGQTTNHGQHRSAGTGSGGGGSSSSQQPARAAAATSNQQPAAAGAAAAQLLRGVPPRTCVDPSQLDSVQCGAGRLLLQHHHLWLIPQNPRRLGPSCWTVVHLCCMDNSTCIL